MQPLASPPLFGMYSLLGVSQRKRHVDWKKHVQQVPRALHVLDASSSYIVFCQGVYCRHEQDSPDINQ